VSLPILCLSSGMVAPSLKAALVALSRLRQRSRPLFARAKIRAVNVSAIACSTDNDLTRAFGTIEDSMTFFQAPQQQKWAESLVVCKTEIWLSVQAEAQEAQGRA
jgi:hypothetical protein